MDRIANFLFEAGTLRKIPRAHMQTLMTSDLSDNIASHSHRVTIIGYFLAKQENVNVEKVLTMCLFHDMGEARSGDQNWVHKSYVKTFEEEIMKDQFNSIIKDNSLFETLNEYSQRESVESNIAKDADRLDQILLLKEYIMQGNQEAIRWLKGKHPEDFYSKTAKDLFLELKDKNPAEWWYKLWSETRR